MKKNGQRLRMRLLCRGRTVNNLSDAHSVVTSVRWTPRILEGALVEFILTRNWASIAVVAHLS